MERKLRVLISGTGFARQGHADAFRDEGAEMAGIVGRTEPVLKGVAAKKADSVLQYRLATGS